MPIPIGKSNNNFTAVFDKNSVKIFKSTEINITALFPPIIQGHRNSLSQTLYSVSLPTIPTSIQKSNATINVSPIRDRVAFYHGDLFSPTIPTWFKAIKNGFLHSWPELTVNQLTKHTPISEATFKGHMHAQRSNIRSTKKDPLNKNMDTTI